MTDKRIAKLLQGKGFDKELFLDGADKALIIEQIQSIAHLPVETIRLGATATRICSDMHAAFENLSPHLCKLTLNGDYIDLEGARALQIFIQNSHLFKLCVTIDNMMFNDARALFTIINSIKQSSVRNLKLHGLFIVERVTEAIIDLIVSSQIVELCLDNCTFENAVLPKIINSISGSRLETFRLCSSSYIDEDILALSACVKNSSLIKLCLVGFCGYVSQGPLMLLTESIQKSNIENLNLRYDNIKATEINACIEGSSIKKLKLKRCYGTIIDSAAIITGIKRCKFIESLHIHNMKIDSLCIDVVCDLLENSNIKTIKFDTCSLKDEQLMVLIKSIKKSSLRSLGLKNNYIGLEGAQAICELLENYDLTKLNLDKNFLSGDIIKSMIPSINKSVLVKLNVNTYHILTNSVCQKTDKKIRNEIKEILCTQQQISCGHHKIKSANNI